MHRRDQRLRLSPVVPRFRAWQAAILAALPALLVLVYVCSYRLAVPFVDEWLLNGRIAILTADGNLTLRDLLFVHSGHRALWTNLTTALFTLLTNWDLRVEGLVTFVLAVVTLALLVALLRRTHSFPAALALLPPLSLLVFSVYRGHNWWAVRHSHWWFANMFVLAALWVTARGQLTWARFAAAAVFGWCATFSMATGMLVWPVVLLALLVRGLRDWRPYALWILAALPPVVLYLWNSGVWSGIPGEDIYVPQAMVYLAPPAVGPFVEFVLRYLATGVFFDPDLPPLTTLVGLIGALLFVVWTFLLLRVGDSRRQLAPWLAVAAFAVGSALLTGLGRIDRNGLERATTVQYAAVAVLFWVALVVLLTTVFWHRFRTSRRFLWVEPLIGVFILVSYTYSSLRALNESHILWQQPLVLSASTELRPQEACVEAYMLTRDAACMDLLLIRPEQDLRMLDEIAARDLALFADLPSANALPPEYRVGDPVVIAGHDAWANYHARDRLLAGVPSNNVSHLVQDGVNLEGVRSRDPSFEQTVIDTSRRSLARFEAWLASSERVWVLHLPGAETILSPYTTMLEDRGYTARAYPMLEPAPYTILRFTAPG